MPSLQIGFPPIVVQVQLDELDKLRRYLRGFVRRRAFAGYCHIVSKHSGKCLDVLESRRDDCAPIIQHSIHGGENQQWLFVRTPDGYYHIFVKHSGKCLDVMEFSKSDAATVWQYAFHGGDNQKWELRPVADECHHILAKHSGKALDVSDWSLADGGKVFQYALHGGANQCWRIEMLNVPANLSFHKAQSR